MSIFDNLRQVQARMAAAASRAGRDTKDIELVAVTKYAADAEVAELLRTGQIRSIGESRIQDAVRKKEQFSSAPVLWRMIGHLQSNKVRKALRIFDSIDSLDSLGLAETLDAQLKEAGKTLPVLVQIKLSARETQYGIQPDELEGFLKECALLPRIKVQGLMAIGPMTENVEDVRPHFRRAKQLFDRFFAKAEAGIQKPILSMGMSRDFEIAIEEGATMVRLGSVLFAQENGG